jgi:hypothetical protein
VGSSASEKCSLRDVFRGSTILRAGAVVGGGVGGCGSSNNGGSGSGECVWAVIVRMLDTNPLSRMVRSCWRAATSWL